MSKKQERPSMYVTIINGATVRAVRCERPRAGARYRPVDKRLWVFVHPWATFYPTPRAALEKALVSRTGLRDSNKASYQRACRVVARIKRLLKQKRYQEPPVAAEQ